MSGLFDSPPVFRGDERRIIEDDDDLTPSPSPTRRGEFGRDSVARRGRGETSGGGRRQAALAKTLLLWVVVFLCAILIAATIGESAERAHIEAQAQAVRAQNAAVQRDINKTQRALEVARSPAEIEREALHWGYRRANGADG